MTESTLQCLSVAKEVFLKECSVSSNKVFLTLLQSYLFSFLARSAWSRAEEPIEIGDLSREESLDYLIKAWNQDC